MNNPHLFNGNLMNLDAGELLNRRRNKIYIFLACGRGAMRLSDINLGSTKKCYYEVYSQRAGDALTMNYQFVRLIVHEIFMNNKTIEMLRGDTAQQPGPSLGNQTKNLCLSKP